MVESRGGRRFAAFFFVGAFLVLLFGRWLHPVSHAATSATAPFVAVLSGAASGLSDAISSVVEGPSLFSENKRLRKEIGTIAQQNLFLRQKVRDDNIFRRMLKYDNGNNTMDFLTAQVIARDPNNFLSPWIIINRGRRDGLQIGMTVVDQNGYFVGAISELMSNAARVLLLTNPTSSVGAMDPETRATGNVEGQYSGDPLLRWVAASAVLRKGDLVVTSGQLNLYPRNILIGQITRVDHSNVSIVQRATVRPAADMQSLELVQVIRNFKPSVPARLLKQP